MSRKKILQAAEDQLDSVQFCDNNYKDAIRAEQEVDLVLREALILLDQEWREVIKKIRAGVFPDIDRWIEEMN